MRFFIPFFVFSTLFAKAGFFQADFQPRPFPNLPPATLANSVSDTANLVFTIQFQDTLAQILPTLFGNNSNFYLYKLNQDSAGLAHLRASGMKNMRLPGGNVSNNWLWDGTVHWELWENYQNALSSAPTSPNNLQSQDQIALADSLGAMPQPCVNVALARYIKGPDSIAQAASYAADWVRELNNKQGRKVKYWEVGNENYGSWVKGYVVNGDTITASMYGNLFNAFADSMKAADPSIKIGAVVFEGESNSWTGNWNQELLPLIQDHADYLVVHQYFTWAKDYNDVSVAEVLGALPKIAETKKLLQDHVEQYTTKARDYFPIAMTEYNTRAGRKNSQQISAVFNAMALGEFASNEYGLVNIWDIANSFGTDGDDHGMLSRKDPNRNDYSPNPSFYSYFLANLSFGDHLVRAIPQNALGVYVYATLFSDGSAGLFIINSSNSPQTIQLELNQFTSAGNFYSYHLTANGPEEREVFLNGQSESLYSGPLNYQSIPPYEHTFSQNPVVSLAAYSVNSFLFPSSRSTTKNANPKTLFPNPNQHSKYLINGIEIKEPQPQSTRILINQNATKVELKK